MIKRSNSYTGTATWFSPEKNGGNYGACWGEWIDDDSEIVALNGDQYGDMDGNSKWCGKRVQINGPHGTVTAKIMDACPGCGWGDLDLTPTLFKRVVGDLDKGVGEIKWKVL
ncbi:RlpA-like double-psi beta-barrel-protein domain-containing protein-containing protein [Mycotypha africana]|uniref:RlpA-like double-psi beta-barrel-protein domain-containing protein-containing protein n=1 Tax=Mycotypha africana TaxID=64632 RepID=UPI002301F0AC|nr:RlpA-like double-psi beta-barrel-protein domain-containing protein-containing protein [Mycotypha africana]KAI8975583.1 RlpA-like double-psi beta-barrel-protein domain-containing protein-containing protein [Mycotypha africana]